MGGREAGGAFVVCLRYGAGTVFHKIEGHRDVYWTGPSVGFDVGGNASKSFVLVYNLYDTQELFNRFPAGEGAAYLVGGFTASYLRRGDVVLIPNRLGRSEENTSELQSLMRILYAVFCLKKKNMNKTR